MTFRGLVDTRLRKLEDGQVDATLLAVAGLKRLGKVGVITELLGPEDFPPAPAQGAIGLESRIGDARVDDLLAAVNDPVAFDTVSCERAFLAALDGSCRTPIAGYAVCEGDRIRFSGLIVTPDGSREHGTTIDGNRRDATALGHLAGTDVREQAGSDFFEDWG
jgi:hydroxymethylbilane synthase